MEEVEQAREVFEDAAPEETRETPMAAAVVAEDGDPDQPQPQQAPEQQAQEQQNSQEEIEKQESLFIAESSSEPAPSVDEFAMLKAVIEAAIYITDEPLSPDQISTAIGQPIERVKEILAKLVDEYSAPDRGLSVREVAGGYKLSTKAEHHESIRRFVKRLQPPLKLSLAALETLAVVAYKQPITAPEIMEVRGVQGAGVLKTLLDRKLIATAGRKTVLGKPIMYKTTREFLVQFGLSSLAELPTLKEFEELGRMALNDAEDGTIPAEPSPKPEAAQVEAAVALESEIAAEAAAQGADV
jgi:segregation and condensation protein B